MTFRRSRDTEKMISAKMLPVLRRKYLVPMTETLIALIKKLQVLIVHIGHVV